MKRLFRITHRATLYCALCFLSTLAILLSILRLWLLPAVADYRQALETRIGVLIGEAVRIDDLSARLHGFHPELSIAGLNILDPAGRSAIRFATVRLELDLFRTLTAGEPRFGRAEIVGPKLSVRRNPDGTLAVLGLAIKDQRPAWLLANGSIDLLEVELDWQDTRTGAPPLALGKVDLSLRNRDGRHRLSARFDLPGNLGRSLRLVVDARGDPFSTDWAGRLYLEGHGLALGNLAPVLSPLAFGLRSGIADAGIWVDWEGGPTRIAGEFEARNPVFGHRPDSGSDHRLAMKAVAGRFSWKPTADGWRLDLNRFRPILHRAWPDTRLAVAVRRGADGVLSSIAAGASHLDLADLELALESLGLLQGETRETLRSLAPRGTLGNLRFFHAPAAPLGERAAFCGRFRDLGLNGLGPLPGFSGFRGEACGSDGAGHARLSAAPGKLVLAGQGLERPVTLTRMQAELSWQRTDAGWTLSVPSLSARNPDFRMESRGRVVLPGTPDASAYLDLETRLTGVDVTALPHYLPVGRIPDTAHWLEQALNGGKVTHWDILLRGPVADFPFPRNEGTFESNAEIQRLALRFHPDWLPLTSAQVRLRFHGPRLEVRVDQGRIGRGEIVEAQGLIEDFARNPWLAVTGRVRAGIGEALDYLAQSPLRAIPECLRREASASGHTDIALNLKIPLGSTPGEPGVEGTATLHDADLAVEAFRLGLDHLNGPLNFSRNGLSADGLTARLLGEPVHIDIAKEQGEMRVGLHGRAGIAALQEQFPGDFWRYARGAADYHLGLYLPETPDPGRTPLRLTLNSDLAGIALDLPEPFAKPELSVRRLAIETRLGLSAKVPLSLAYGQEFKARLRFVDQALGFRLEGGEIAIGQPLPKTGDASGLALRARMDALDLAQWRRWWSALPGDRKTAGSWRALNLQIGRLAWNGVRLGRLDLELARHGGAWLGRIDGGYAKGEIAATADSVRLDLETLKIPQRLEGRAAIRDPVPPTADSNRNDVDPAGIPGLSLHAKHLLRDKTDLGTLNLETERRAHGMIVKTLKLAAGSHQLELHGGWTRTPQRAPGTHIEGRLHIDDLGKFLAGLGYPGEVRETASDAEFALDWPGAPYRFSAAAVTGDLKLNLGKGGLLKVEPGLGRVIGVLNLNSLWRRLTLDFSDLFGEGLAYDGISGSLRIGGGQALTEGFLIDAVSAKIVAGGRVGLVDRNLDQVVTVIPHTTATLPIAGALAGGPAVGAAVYVAQKLIGEEVDSITATHYSVRGRWDNPTITRTGRNLPLNVLDRAWSGVKNLPVFGNSPEEPP